MNDKITVLMVYAILGIMLGLLPILGHKFSRSEAKRKDILSKYLSFNSSGLAVSFCVAVCLILLRGWIDTQIVVMLLATGLVAAWGSKARDRFAAVAFFIALYIATSLPWWREADGSFSVSLIQLCFLCTIAIIFALVFMRDRLLPRSGSIGWWLAAYSVPVFVISFSTGITVDEGAFVTLWHHWGAYIGPAEAVLSGATLFVDIPVQYGLGPTFLISSVCLSDCWTGMYFLTGISVFLYGLGVSAMALALSRDDVVEKIVVLVLCFVAGYFWTAYPPSVASPIVTPSTTGMRFLPAVALACYLFFQDANCNSKLQIRIAFTLWGVGALWSPESAFYVTFIWWPYYLWLQVTSTRKQILWIAATAVFNLFVSATILVFVFVGMFYVVYQSFPTLSIYLAYAINPPGTMPINPHGAILFFVMATVLAAIATILQLRQDESDRVLLRRGFIVQLLSYAAASYFLGRSHDNNVLNVMPFILLTLLYSMRALNITPFKLAATGLSSAIVGWLGLFGWAGWHNTFADQVLFRFEGSTLVERLTWSDPETANIIERRFQKFGINAGNPSDAARALSHIDRLFGEPVTVLDFSMLIQHQAPNSAWSAIHGPANFVYIPANSRRHFLYQSAQVFNRAGWLLIDRSYPADNWLSDYASAYEITDQLEFGTYYALRMIPIVEE